MTAMVIVAGGAGTRLQSVIGEVPKVLAPIGEVANIVRLLGLAVEFGYREVFVLTGHGDGRIRRFLESDSTAQGLDLSVIKEPAPLGTAGCFLGLPSEFNDRMFVIYGDISCDFDIGRLERFHAHAGCAATVLTQPNGHNEDSDLLKVDANGKIVEVRRKPHPRNHDYENLTSAAAYILEPSVLDLVPNERCDWFHHVFPAAIAADIAVKAYQSWEYLQDYGEPARYRKALEDESKGLLGRRRANGLCVGGLFVNCRGHSDVSPDIVASVKMFNADRLPLCLCGPEAESIQMILSKRNAYADYLLPEFVDGEVNSLSQRFGFFGRQSRVISLAEFLPSRAQQLIEQTCNGC